jgi:tetratricopeptide (TPR) repeat protein
MRYFDWIKSLWRTSKDGGNSPEDLYKLMQVARMRLLNEDYDGAQKLLLAVLRDRAHIENPEALDYLLTSLGGTWIFTDRFDEAVDFFSEYIKQYPADSLAYHERANAYWYKGELKKAIADYSHNLERRSGFILSLSSRGQVLAEAGDSARAMADLDEALRLIDSAEKSDAAWAAWCKEIEAFVRNGRALALGSAGEFDLAMEEFGRSLRLSPNNAWAFYNRAIVNERRGWTDVATRDYRQSLSEKNPPLNPLRKKIAEGKTGRT